jgi:hypothetical protein
MGTVAGMQDSSLLGHPSFFSQEREERTASIATKRPRTICIDVVHFPICCHPFGPQFDHRSKKDDPIRPHRSVSIAKPMNFARIRQFRPIASVK